MLCLSAIFSYNLALKKSGIGRNWSKTGLSSEVGNKVIGASNN